MKIKEKLSKVINKVENILFPHYVCPFCGEETPAGQVCDDCNKLKIQPNFCIKCGGHVSGIAQVCMQCKEYEHVFDKNFSVYEYAGNSAAAIVKLKFKEAKYLAVDFAKILASRFAESGISADIVTYVPTTAKKLKERRYNQSAEMAKEFAKLTNLVCLDLLDKTKDTADQKELSRRERLKNLLGSIVVKDKWQVKGKDILVIDDVFTTGGTMDACAKALKRAGANKVYGLTVCKTLLEQNDKNI